eukprot:5254514-Pleurochrysis_carterae.AAC.1
MQPGGWRKGIYLATPLAASFVTFTAEFASTTSTCLLAWLIVCTGPSRSSDAPCYVFTCSDAC